MPRTKAKTRSKSKPAAKPAAKRRARRDPTRGNQGEGNRGADRLYRESATRFARSGRAERGAEEARRSLGDSDAARDAGAGEELGELERNARKTRELTGRPSTKPL